MTTTAQVFNFDVPFNEPLVHQAVLTCLSNGHSHKTKKQKTRAEVSGGGRKPWRQKGTGNARAGSIRSPIWRGGGKVFAATPRVVEMKLNKKMYRGALRSILSELSRQNRINVLDNIEVKQPKTKSFLELIAGKNIDLEKERLLIVTHDFNENLYLAARNLFNVDICMPDEINPVNLVSAHHIMMTKQAVQVIEETIQC